MCTITAWSVACTHAARTGIRCDIGLTVCHRKGLRFVRREVVPEIGEIDLFPPGDEALSREPMKGNLLPNRR